MNPNPRLRESDSPMTAVVKMCEGNPGAATALSELLNTAGVAAGLMAVLTCDDLGLYGWKIWIAYKDYCGQDAEKFYCAVMDRDPKMLAEVAKHEMQAARTSALLDKLV